jgi:hypothetical protein
MGSWFIAPWHQLMFWVILRCTLLEDPVLFSQGDMDGDSTLGAPHYLTFTPPPNPMPPLLPKEVAASPKSRRTTMGTSPPDGGLHMHDARW